MRRHGRSSDLVRRVPMRNFVCLGLVGAVALAACVPAEPAPVYYPPPQQQYGQPQPPPPQPQPPPPAPSGPVFDARGWTLLGSTTVTGARDRDVIPVGRYS